MRGTDATTDATTDAGALHDAIAEEYRALAGLLEAAGSDVWDTPSLCEKWRTREVVAHVTMPARYDVPAFMAELEAAGGDFTRLSDAIAARDGALPARALLADLRSPVLHGWEPPGGGAEAALTHCVIHALDITEAVPLARRVPEPCLRTVLRLVEAADGPNVFGVDLHDVALQADDLEWSSGSGTVLRGSAQALAVVACGRLLPPGRLHGEAAARFTRSEGPKDSAVG